MKIAFFGSFYPRIDRLSTTSIGLTYLFGNVSDVEEVTVYGPTNSRIPSNFPAIVNLNAVWEYDDISSFLRALKIMFNDRKKYDVFFFNLILTSFGKRGSSNAFGLLIPVIFSFLSRKRVIVYLHHLVETQDIASLGYGGRKLSTAIARLIERLILVSTQVIVPLPSHQKRIGTIVKRVPLQFVFPGLEGIWAYRNYLTINNSSRTSGNIGIRILIFGAFGPQKDIAQVLKIIDSSREKIGAFHVTLAGSINSNFPNYEREVEKILADFDKGNLTLIRNPVEEEVPDLFINADLLLLPYKAAGGYSAVMNIAQLYCLRILCYDNNDLRIFSDLIESDAKFVDISDPDKIINELKGFVWTPRILVDSEIMMKSNIQKINEVFNVVRNSSQNRRGKL